MKPPKFEYLRPTTLEEALQLLAEGEGQPIAGGQSLVPAMNFRLANPARLVDLGALTTLSGIAQNEDGDIVAGAMARHADFERNALVRSALPMLPYAMAGVAHTAIRNRGTIGGSLAHADPAADWPVLCMACESHMTLSALDGEREVPSTQFSLGMFETALQPGELLTAVRFPRWPTGRRWGVQKFTRRRGDFAIVGVALTLDLDDNGVCTRSRIVLQGVSSHPVLAESASAILVGQKPDEACVRAAAHAARAVGEPTSDLHASVEFRISLIETLTCRALKQALHASEAAHG